jgi:two-component system, chemotaxis family, chemotaxis protein CheY
MTILCVDDSNTIRMLVKKALEPEGFTIMEAENGKLGLEAAKAGKVDACIVDVNMPEMDGFGFVEGLRKEASYANTPIIFLTTESSEEKKSRGAALGVKGWIVKPFDPPSLVKVMKMLLA